MFAVSDADAAAIRAVFHQRGELSAAVELRRLFPGLNAETARECARTIVGWERRSGAAVMPSETAPRQQIASETCHAKHTAIQNPTGPRAPRS
jgi:hypothetical protein